MTKSDLNIILEESKEKAIKRKKLFEIKEKIATVKNMVNFI